jgi:hypothetical protein
MISYSLTTCKLHILLCSFEQTNKHPGQMGVLLSLVGLFLQKFNRFNLPQSPLTIKHIPI